MTEMKARFSDATVEQLKDDYVYQVRDGATTLVGPRREAVLALQPDVLVLGQDQSIRIGLQLRPEADSSGMELEILWTLPSSERILGRSHLYFKPSAADEVLHTPYVTEVDLLKEFGDSPVVRPGMTFELRTNLPHTANRSALLRLI